MDIVDLTFAEIEFARTSFLSHLIQDTIPLFTWSRPMEINKITDYVNSREYVGLDRVLKFQLKADGWLASKIGLSALAPTGFILGFMVCYFIFVV